ncbi:hypothetical protein HNY73_010071 [Argiope bruennichi]|uniref:Uncharacterized protein n=1 Tax=Argiope bruennichi TaxID=94029 RepID=A0A8T0F4Q5_ARGBR|nr:hypothetical protein HNY73_010071 [Argiope bruennichi]
MVKCFEETDNFVVKAGRGRKTQIPEVIEDFAISVVEQAKSNTSSTSSARIVSSVIYRRSISGFQEVRFEVREK